MPKGSCESLAWDKVIPDGRKGSLTELKRDVPKAYLITPSDPHSVMKP
jgi:hypothetical protein